MVDQNADRQVCYYSECQRGKNCQQALCEVTSVTKGTFNTCSETFEENGELIVGDCEDLDQCA